MASFEINYTFDRCHLDTGATFTPIFSRPPVVHRFSAYPTKLIFNLEYLTNLKNYRDNTFDILIIRL